MDKRARDNHNGLVFNDSQPFKKQIVAKLTNKSLTYPATYQSLFTNSEQYSFLFQPAPKQQYTFSDVLGHCFFEVITSGLKDNDDNIVVKSKIYSNLRFTSEIELVEFVNKNVANDGVDLFLERVNVNVYLLTKSSDMFVKGRNSLFHAMVGRRTNTSSRYPRHLHNQPEYRLWDPGFSYSLDIEVIHEDVIYRSLTNNNIGNTPFAGSGYWQQRLHYSSYIHKQYITKTIWAYFGVELDVEDPSVYESALRSMWVPGNKNTWYAKYGINHSVMIQSNSTRMYYNNGLFTTCGNYDIFQTGVEHHVVVIDNEILNDGTPQPGTGRLNGACRIFPHLSYNNLPIEHYPAWNLGEHGPYALDEVVRYGRKIYTSSAVNNIQTPGSHPTWREESIFNRKAPNKKMFEHIQSMFIVSKIIYNADPTRFALLIKPAGMDMFSLTVPLANIYSNSFSTCQVFALAEGIGKSPTVVKIPDITLSDDETVQRTGVIAMFHRLSFFHYLVPVKSRTRGALRRNILKILLVKDGYAIETKNPIRLVTNNLSKFELLT